MTEATVHDTDPCVSLSRQQEVLSNSPTCTVPIDSLVISESPRLDGENSEHIQALAESAEELPPIWVHEQSKKIIDGVHRVRAAVARGTSEIEVRFFCGSEMDAFLLSVSANIRHGRPLSQRDRIAAAERIITARPEWSDRMIASLAGVSPNRVAPMRRQAANRIQQPARRVGRDGRSRPVDSAQGRQRAAEIITENPSASLRQIARAAGISPATAANVRHQVDQGASPVSNQVSPERERTKIRSPAPTPGGGHAENRSLSELTTMFDRLRRDPSLRFSDAGRSLLRMFDAVHAALDEQEQVLHLVPPHSRASVAELTRGYAQLLQQFSEELKRIQSTNGQVPNTSAS